MFEENNAAPRARGRRGTREVRIGSFPIGIDYNTYAGLAERALYLPALAISGLVVGVNLTADGLRRALRAPGLEERGV